MLALIAGQGALPARLAPLAAHVAALEGYPPIVDVDETFRIEHLGSFRAALVDRGITEVCFAGSLQRPPLDPSAVDAETMPLVPRMMQALQAGDDAALRTVLGFFEEAGLAIRGAHELAPDLLPEPGLLAPGTPVPADVSRGVEAIAAMGAVDIGQAVVVHRGQVLTIEGSFGTDWMLDGLRHRPDGAGGVLVKGPKPGQDMRIDVPTIGPETVRKAHAAGLDGIAVLAGGVMVLDREVTVAEAEELGLFLLVQA